jgi:hypothetical protein
MLSTLFIRSLFHYCLLPFIDQSSWDSDRERIDPSVLASSFELRRLFESLPPLVPVPFQPATLVHHCIFVLIGLNLLL